MLDEKFWEKNKMKRLKFKTKKYVIKEIDPKNLQEIEAVWGLRYEVYCKELNWVPSKEKGKEYDKYDRYAIHFGVFDTSGKLVGTSRIILPSPYGFMLENEFKNLVDAKEIKRLDIAKTVEISRMALRPSVRGLKDRGHKVSEHLYKIMYKWSKIHKKRYWLCVVEKKYFQVLHNSLFIPMHTIGKSQEYTKGVISLPIMIDLREAKKELMNRFLKSHLPKFSKLLKFFKHGN